MNILKKCEKQNRYEGQRAKCWTGGGVGQMQKKKMKLKEREQEAEAKHRRAPSRPLSSKTTVTPRGARDNNGQSEREE